MPKKRSFLALRGRFSYLSYCHCYLKNRFSSAAGKITIGLTPLQVSGSTSAGRVICGTDLAECVSVPGDFLRPQGAFPQAFTPFRGGLGSLPGAWGASNKGNADGAEGIFGKLRVRVGYGPAPGPTQKRSCAIHALKVGRASNTAR